RISNTGNYANDWNRDPTPTFGAVNDASAVNLGSSIVINEYQTNATSGTNILELYNPTGGDIDVTGWFFTDSDATYSSIGTLTGTVTASGYLVFTRDLTTPSANVSINGDAIYLYDSTGVRVDQASDYDYSIASGNTGQRVPNGTGGTNDGYNWITSGFTDQEPTWDATNNLCDNTDTTAPDWAVSGVSNVAAVFVSDHVEVSWDIATDAENPNKIYYNIHRSLVSGFTPDGGNLVDTVLNLTSYNDFGADKLQTNYYKISVHNCDNDSRNGTDEASVWVPDPPEIPVIISCSGGNQAIFIDWGDITGAEYYNIYRATDEGGPYLVEDTSTTSKFTDSNVINGTTYYYVITTYDSTKNPNESDYSDERYAIPETCYPIGDTVLISEICIDPRVGIDDMYGEWIELYNPTDTPISIDGWSLSDTGIDTHTIGVECPEVPAYGYLLMAATSNPVLNDNLDWDYIYCRASGGPGCFALKDGEDEVILKDAAGNTVDLLIYDDTWFDRGYSITKVDMLACSNQVDSWDNETTQWNPPDSGYGTPGTSNFPFGLYFAEATTLTQVDFSFIHEVDNASADDILKYTIYESSTPGNVITLSVLSLDPDNIHGTLTTANLTPGMKYTLEISNIQDAYLRPVTVEFSKYEFFAPMQLTDGLNPILFPEWSNDGNSVAYVVYDINTTKSQVWIAAVDGSSTNQITNDSDAVWHGGQLTWSIDDQWVAYTALQSSPVNHGQIRKINVNSTGGDSEKLEPPSSDSYGWGRWTDPDWTTATNQWDGTEKMAISISGDIWVCDPNLIAADHLSLVRLTQFSMPYSDYTTVDKLYQPKWSEDNNSITFVRRHPGAGTTETDIYVIENVQTYLSAGTTISNWANPDVTLLSDAAELYVWSPSFSLDNSMVSYVNDTSGNFNNTTFWSTPGVAISASNFDAYMEKSSGLDTDGQVMESTSDNEGFMKWAPAGGDRFTFVERTADGTYSLKLLSNQITVGFSKAKKNSGKIFDFSYSGIILSYKDLGTGQLSIEAPFINVKDYTSPPNYKYIGEVREILINEDVVELNDYADVQIHFRNAEVRNLDVNSLKIFYLNKDKNQWIKLGGTVMMDDTGGTVYAQTKFTGTFAIFGKTTSTKAPLVSKEVRVFPNPYRPNDGDIITGTPDSFIIFNHLPEDVETIEIYSIAGEKIATSDDTILINNAMNTARWNAANVSGSKVASGIYIYVIKSPTETKTGKIAIIK
ncbi:lamin tail domain-containing protein, partial [Candidatus Dependentiae bacterium]|nr:lamin tail domain-containing protein [Candidatus Dependentiae bacterium]